MADGSALLSLVNGLIALHGGPLDDASGYIFFREIYAHLSGMIERFGTGLFGRVLLWVSYAGLILVTLWLMVEGYGILIGRSQRSMIAFLGEMMRAVVITAVATGSALGGGTLYEWVNHGLGQAVHAFLTGHAGDVFEAIDRTLGYLQLALGSIDEIQTGGDLVLEGDKDRNKLAVVLGIGLPAVIAGAWLLMFDIMLAMCLGLAPLFVLGLLFRKTEPLFWGWLNYFVGTLFALSILHVMAAIAMDMICAIAATFWTLKLTGADVEGVNSLALQQGGIGLLLTALIFSAPAIAAKFFKGLLGDFSPYSAFGNAGASRTSAGQAPHGHTHTREHGHAPTLTHAHRVSAPAQAQADEVKQAADARSFLERYPNATASLKGHGGSGDPLPTSLQPEDTANGLTDWSARLGDRADEIIAYSPTLQSDISRLVGNKWELTFGSQGSKTNRNTSPQTISIDEKWKNDPKEILRALSHEVGHATYKYVADYSSKEAYIDGVLADEAAALMKNIEIRREILTTSQGRIDIGINGTAANHDAYNAAYDQFLNDSDAEKSLKAIGEIFGDKETVAVENGAPISYREYYGSWY